MSILMLTSTSSQIAVWNIIWIRANLEPVQKIKLEYVNKVIICINASESDLGHDSVCTRQYW